MTPGLLQRFVDHVRSTSTSCWVQRVAAVLMVIGASVVTGVSSGHFGFWIVILVGGTSVGAVAQPDSHLGLVAIGLVVAQWLAVVDVLSTGWAMVVASLLFGFHALVALLASIPHTAQVPREVQMVWLRRGAVVSAATVAMWAMVLAFDQRNGDGNVTLSFLALAGLFGLTIAARARTFDSSE